MKNTRVKAFLMGGICFTVAQPLLRMPILNLLQNSTKIVLYSNIYPILVGVLIALSAGIFEEGFRFIFKRTLFKKDNMDIWIPILFGLGHGLTEAIMILFPVFQILPASGWMLPSIERLLAVVIHIGLTVIIWNGFLLNKRLKYLFIGVFVHGAINSLIPILSLFTKSVLLLESIFLVIALLMVIYVYRSRKIYNMEA